MTTGRPRPDTEGALFEVPKRKPAGAELAVAHSVTQWRKDGHTIDAGTSRLMRSLGYAVDLAERRQDIRGINAAVGRWSELVERFGLITTSAADPFIEAMERALSANDADDATAEVS